MSDFIFKIPELPEDTLLKRRKIGVSRERNNDRNRVPFCPESGNMLQTSLMHKSKTGDCFRLKSLRENNEEDLARPSTSKFVNDNKFNIFQSSFANSENQNAYKMNVSTTSNCFLDTRMRTNGFNYSFNNSNQQDMSHPMFTSILSRCNPNLSSMSTNNPYQVLNPNFKNPSARFNNLYGNSQCDYLNNPKYFNVNNVPCSSMSTRKSVFSSGLLPEKSGVKNMSLNKSINKASAKFNSYETLNGTGIIAKDSVCPLNSSQSVLENQTIMKSVLQTSVVSIKEQIMNTLENFGQTLLRNAPEMEESFLKVAKDVKGIFENSSIFMNQVMGTTEMFSTLNCTSDGIDFRLQNMLQCQYQSHGPSKKPCNILKEIQTGQNEIKKVEFVKTFTVEEKKLRNSSRDIFDLPSQIVESKEVNLRNWYPVALQEGLAFSGLNDENIEFKTGTVKKRINGRKVLLNNGYICNLIGKGNPEKKFPSDISRKLKNGIDSKWKILKEKIAKFQKECQENIKIPSSDILSSAHNENSSHTSRQKNKTNFVTPCKVNNDDDDETCRELDFISPKSTKIKPQSRWNDQNQNKKRKTDDTKKEKTFENDKKKFSTLEKDESNKNKKAKVEHKEDHSSRVIHVTRSGRAVKRPGDLWTGNNFNSENMESESKLNASIKTQVIPVPPQGNEEGGTGHLKRKRVATEKASIETKKNKSEKSKNEDVQTNRTVQKRRERTKKTSDNSKPKSLNSTLSSGRKNCKNKGYKKNTTGPPKNEHIDSWVNDFDDGLINISELPSEELNADIKNMKLISMETPPLKILRSHLKILRSCTPVTQSPCWLLSQHTESGVKKFEKVRARTFKQKIPKEKVSRSAARKPKIDARNKDVDAVVNWIGEREVKSPTRYSKVMKYVIPKRSELEGEDEMDDWEDDKQMQ